MVRRRKEQILANAENVREEDRQAHIATAQRLGWMDDLVVDTEGGEIILTDEGWAEALERGEILTSENCTKNKWRWRKL